MALKWSFLRRYTSTDLRFFTLLSMTWICFFVLLNCTQEAPLSLDIVFALISSVTSFGALHLFGYFNALKILPRKSDVLLALTAMLMGGALAQSSFKIITGSSFCSGVSLYFGTCLLALLVFGGHYAISLFLFKQGRKKKIIFDLTAAERAELMEILSDKGTDAYVEVINLVDLTRETIGPCLADVSLAVISRGAAREFDTQGGLLRAHLNGIPIMDFRMAVAELTGRIRLDHCDLWTYLMGATRQTFALRTLSLAKDVIEPFVALALALLFAPIMLAVAIAIRINSPGPLFYKQLRTGYLGHPFILVKFRSMRIDSESNGPRWASSQDDRVTSVGAFLRRTRLDELPQLWNVFKGEMSFFGPRPERPEICLRLSEQIPLFPLRLIVRPGITGWAQVCAGYAASIAESALKLEYDLFYIQHMSPRLDMIILLRTLWVALVGDEVASKRRASVAEIIAQ